MRAKTVTGVDPQAFSGSLEGFQPFSTGVLVEVLTRGHLPSISSFRIEGFELRVQG
jgi:hypothetical protein